MVSATTRQSLFDALHPETGNDASFVTAIKVGTAFTRVAMFSGGRAERAIPSATAKGSGPTQNWSRAAFQDRISLWNLVLNRLHRIVSEERYCSSDASKVPFLFVCLTIFVE